MNNYRVMEQHFQWGDMDVKPILSRVGHQQAILHATALNKAHQANPTSGVRVYYVELQSKERKR